MSIEDLLNSVIDGVSPSVTATTLDPIIYKYSAQYGVDPDLVKSVIGRESGGNTGAVSPKGALGAMQVMPSTGRGIAAELGEDFDRSKLKDPETNIKYGTYLLSQLLEKHDGNPSLALAEYHGGGKAVLPGGIINPKSNDGLSSTTDYVDSILKNKPNSGIDGLASSIFGESPVDQAVSPDQVQVSDTVQTPSLSPEAQALFAGGSSSGHGATGSFGPTLLDKANTIEEVALKNTGKYIADLADLVFTPIQNAFAGLTGNETIAPKSTPMQGVKESLTLSDDEKKQMDEMGLPARIAAGATELILQTPLFAASAAGGVGLVRGIVSKFPREELTQIIPVLSKIRPGVFKLLQETAGDMIGFAGLGAAEAVGGGGTPVEIAKAAESNAIMAGAGRLAGGVSKLIPEVTPAVIKKAGKIITTGSGFAAGTKLSGGTNEQALEAGVLGGVMGAMHPVKKAPVDRLADQVFGKEGANVQQEVQGREKGEIIPVEGQSGPLLQTTPRKPIIDQTTGIQDSNTIRPLITVADKDPTKDVMILDIDDFKSINDTYGHDKGDQVLSEVGKKLNSVFGPENVGRLGGEEFGVVLDKDQHDSAMRFMKELPIEVKINNQPVTVSGGIGNDATDADQSLFKSKQLGKNQILVDNKSKPIYTIQGTPVGEKKYVYDTDLRQLETRAARLLGSSQIQSPEDRVALEGTIQAVQRIRQRDNAVPWDEPAGTSSSDKAAGPSQSAQPSVEELLNTPEYNREKFLSDLNAKFYDDLKNGWVDRKGVTHPGGYKGWLQDYNLLTERKDLTGKTRYAKSGERISPSPNVEHYLQDIADTYAESEDAHIALADIGFEVPKHADDVRVWLKSSRHPTRDSEFQDSFKSWETKYLEEQRVAQENQQAGIDEETADYWKKQDEKRQELLKETGYPPEWDASTGKFAKRTAPDNIAQVDLFGNDKSLAQIEQERIAAQQKNEIKYRQVQTVGGSADPNLPLFRGTGAVEGEQGDLFGGSAIASVGKYAERQTNPALVEMPELVEIARNLSGNEPVVKVALRALNGTALGTFRPDATKQIDLRADLFKEPEQAAKTLSHEIGHLVDFLPDNTLSRGNILGHIATLKNYLKHSLDAEPEQEGQGFQFTNENKIFKPEVMQELKTLTQIWKPFDDTVSDKFTKYRYSPKELYADAFSVLLNEPKLLKDTAPQFYNSLFSYMDRKPEVKQLYDDIQERIGQGQEVLLQNRENNLLSAYQVGENKFKEAQIAAEKKKTGFVENVKQLLWDADRPISNAMKGKNVDPENNPHTMVRESRYQGSEIQNLLDNVGTRVLRPLYDSGVDENDLGLYLQSRRASTERASLANPGGVGERFASQQLDYLKKRVGPDKYSQIEKAAEEYWKIRNELIIPKLEASRMYSKELMDKIKDNKNYATFQVLDHLNTEGGGGGGISGSIKRQIGTLKDIANPFTATVLKDSVLLRAAQKNNTIKSTIEMLGSDAKPSETRWVNNHHEPIEQPLGADLKTVKYYSNGKVKVYDIARDIADVIDKEPAKANPAIKLITIPGRILKSVFVQYNPFWIARNIPRDLMTTWKNFDRASIKEVLKFYSQVVPDAFKEVFNSESSPLLQQMKREKAYFVGRNWNAKDLEDAETEIDRRLINFGKNPDVYKRKVVGPYTSLLKDLIKFGSIENWGRMSEVMGKAAGFKMIQEKYPEVGPRQRAEMVRRRVGTPDFLTGGRARLLYNNFWLFSNVNKEGWRGGYESFKQNPRNFILKTAMADIAPTVITKALEIGLLAGVGGIVGQYFDDYKKLFAGIPERDKTNYYCVPYGQTESGKTLYFILPKEQNTGIVSGLLRKIMNLAEDKNPEGLKNAISLVSGAAPTGNINPLIEELFNWNDFLMGTGHPRNFYTGQEILSDQERAAGGWYAWKKMLEASISDLGGSVWFKFPDDKNQAETEFEKIYGIPIAGRALNTFIRVSDQGYFENLKSSGGKTAHEKAILSLDIKNLISESVKNGDEVGRPTARRLFDNAKSQGYTQPFSKFWVSYQGQVIKSTATPEIRAINSARTTDEKNAIIEKILDNRGITGDERQRERINIKRSARILKGTSQ